jgi:hypothetical protein
MRPETQLASTLHDPPAAASDVAHTFAELQMRPETQLASTLHNPPAAAGGAEHIVAMQYSPIAQSASPPTTSVQGAPRGLRTVGTAVVEKPPAQKGSEIFHIHKPGADTEFVVTPI